MSPYRCLCNRPGTAYCTGCRLCGACCRCDLLPTALGREVRPTSRPQLQAAAEPYLEARAVTRLLLRASQGRAARVGLPPEATDVPDG